MTHKNPFEIRAEMLHLAKDYMDTQQQMIDRMANVNYEFEVPELGVSIDDIQYHFNQWLRSIGYVIDYDDR